MSDHENGYGKLASFMADSPILRKYQRLAVRDLLYLQAELCHLEDKYQLIAKKNAAENDERQWYSVNWQRLEASRTHGTWGEQRAIAISIREKLREYYEAILQYSQIASLPKPRKLERRILQDWINRPSLGGGCGFLGRDLREFNNQPTVYDAIHLEDLAILSDNHGEDDLFSRFLTGLLARLYYRTWGLPKAPLPTDPENPAVGENKRAMNYYNWRIEPVMTVVNILGIVFSCLSPLLSIVVLAFLNSQGAKVGLVCVFTLLFSFYFAVATKARTVDIFKYTALFASVQVVFISGANPSI